MQNQDHELESFLPGKNDDYDVATVTGTSAFGTSRRLHVRYCTVPRNPTTFHTMDTKEAVFVTPLDMSIEQAASHAVRNYPDPENAPDFTDISVFFNRTANRNLVAVTNVAVTDLSPNVHEMFGPDDEMIISNDPDVFLIEQKMRLRVICVFLGGMVAFASTMLFVTW